MDVVNYIAVDIGAVKGDCSVEILYRRDTNGKVEIIGFNKWQHDIELKPNPPTKLIEAKG